MLKIDTLFLKKVYFGGEMEGHDLGKVFFLLHFDILKNLKCITRYEYWQPSLTL